VTNLSAAEWLERWTGPDAAAAARFAAESGPGPWPREPSESPFEGSWVTDGDPMVLTASGRGLRGWRVDYRWHRYWLIGAPSGNRFEYATWIPNTPGEGWLELAGEPGVMSGGFTWATDRVPSKQRWRRIGPATEDLAAALEAGLSDPEPEARIFAAIGATRLELRHPAMPGLLLEALKRSGTREGRRELLIRIGDLSWAAKELVPALIDLVRDPACDVRASAANALVGFGTEARAAVPVLLEALGSKDGELAGQAAFALGAVGDERAVDSLLARAEDPDAKVRTQVLHALGRLALRPDEVVPVLARTLQVPSLPLRQAAATALGGFGPRARSAIPALEAAAKDPALKQAAESALLKIR
jgi:hypothetical protein